eukprot:4540806-Amphidinium_carterae.1
MDPTVQSMSLTCACNWRQPKGDVRDTREIIKSVIITAIIIITVRNQRKIKAVSIKDILPPKIKGNKGQFKHGQMKKSRCSSQLRTSTSCHTQAAADYTSARHYTFLSKTQGESHALAQSLTYVACGYESRRQLNSQYYGGPNARQYTNLKFIVSRAWVKLLSVAAGCRPFRRVRQRTRRGSMMTSRLRQLLTRVNSVKEQIRNHLVLNMDGATSFDDVKKTIADFQPNNYAIQQFLREHRRNCLLAPPLLQELRDTHKVVLRSLLGLLSCSASTGTSSCRAMIPCDQCSAATRFQDKAVFVQTSQILHVCVYSLPQNLAA